MSDFIGKRRPLHFRIRQKKGPLGSRSLKQSELLCRKGRRGHKNSVMDSRQYREGRWVKEKKTSTRRSILLGFSLLGTCFFGELSARFLLGSPFGPYWLDFAVWKRQTSAATFLKPQQWTNRLGDKHARGFAYWRLSLGLSSATKIKNGRRHVRVVCFLLVEFHPLNEAFSAGSPTP